MRNLVDCPLLVSLSNWRDPKKRRVAALRALQTRDEESLLELHRTYLALKGRRRARLSPHTLATYETGIREFLAWAWPPEAAGARMPLWTVGAEVEELRRAVYRAPGLGQARPSGVRATPEG